MLQIRRVRVPRHPSIRFTFLESKRFCGRALQRVPQRNLRRSLHKDSVRVGNILYRYLGAGRTVVLLCHDCRQFYREGEQSFQPGARADSVIRHSARVPRTSDPQTQKAGQMPRFAHLSCVQVKRACETASRRRKSSPLLKATMQLDPGSYTCDEYDRDKNPSCRKPICGLRLCEFTLQIRFKV